MELMKRCNGSKRYRISTAVVLLLVAFTPSIAVAGQQSVLSERVVRLSDSAPPRLSALSNDAAPDQLSPFETIIDATFVQGSTLGEAFAQLAHFAGYDFRIAGRAIDPMAKTFFAHPLSEVHRSFEHSSIRHALIALAGEGYTVVVDHATRALSVDVRPAHRVLSRLESEVRR